MIFKATMPLTLAEKASENARNALIHAVSLMTAGLLILDDIELM